jgi:hypothetical protein
VFVLPHYLAPFTAAFYAIGLQAMRHLRVRKFGGKPAGLTLVRLSVAVCLIMAALRINAGPLHLELPQYPATAWNLVWYGPDHFGTDRLGVEQAMEQLPGKHLAIVRYSSSHNPFNEWVYNSADIDNSKVIWAREMDETNNLELVSYYKDRDVWLVQPDSSTTKLSAYPLTEHAIADSH